MDSGPSSYETLKNFFLIYQR